MGYEHLISIQLQQFSIFIHSFDAVAGDSELIKKSKKGGLFTMR